MNLFGLTDPALAAADPWSGPSFTRTQSAAGNLTYMQNATTVWTFNYGFVYSDYGRDPFVSDVRPDDARACRSTCRTRRRSRLPDVQRRRLYRRWDTRATGRWTGRKACTSSPAR